MLLTQNMKIQRWGVVWFALVLLICGGAAQAQVESPSADRRICIEEPREVKATSGSPGLVGYRIEWNVACREGLLPLSSYDYFIVWHSSSSSFPAVERQESEPVTDQGFYVFDNKDSLGQHWFRVLGFLGDNEMVQSQPMNYVRAQNGGNPPSWRPGYLFLEFLRLVTLIDEGGIAAWHSASPTGKAAFDLIGLFFILGMIIWISRTMRTMRSTKVFLVNKDIGGYNECKAIMEEEEFANLTPDQKENVQTLINDRLTRRFFQGLSHWILTWSIWEFAVRHRKDLGRLRRVPTARILLSAVASFKDKPELEKSLEVRILAEEEELRKRSFLEVLWALGVTAPLVGLFGTVTGISQSFKIIKEETQQSGELMTRLAGGINEALYTTICGLIVGILFMLAFYWYNYKLERIHAVWVMFASEFVDQLKHNVQKSSPTPQSPSPASSSDGNK